MKHAMSRADHLPPQKIQFPEHQIQQGFELLGISNHHRWLLPDEIGELIQPVTSAKPGEMQKIDIKRQTGWWGSCLRGSRMQTLENAVSPLNVLYWLGVRTTQNALTVHSSNWDAQSIPYDGRVVQCILQSVERNDKLMAGIPIASMLLHIPYSSKRRGKVPVQQVTLARTVEHEGHETTSWVEPRTIAQYALAVSAVAQMLNNSRAANYEHVTS